MRPGAKSSDRGLRSFFALCALLLPGTIVGCNHNAKVQNLDVDGAFIRVPGERNDLTMGPDNPFPLSTGSVWNIDVHEGDRVGREQMVAVGPMTVGGMEGERMDQRRNGVTVHVDVYRQDASRLMLIATGTPTRIIPFTPPVPLIANPPPVGQTLSWNGVLHYQNNSAYGTAFSRVSGCDKVVTPAGTFPAYRVDTIISTMSDGRPINYSTTRWLTPGVGVTEQRVLDGDQVQTRILQSYKIVKK